MDAPKEPPIPSKALAGLMPEPRRVGPVSLGPFTLRHRLALIKLRSPILVRDDDRGITEDDVLLAAGLLALAPDAIRSTEGDIRLQAEDKGKEIFCSLKPSDFPELVSAINGCIADGFATVLPVAREGAGTHEKKAQSGGS